MDCYPWRPDLALRRGGGGEPAVAPAAHGESLSHGWQTFWILLSAAGLLLLDQLSKQWWLQNLQPGVSHRWIPGLLNLRLVWNDGAAFSLFRNGSLWLGWISLLVSVGLLIWIWRRGRIWSRWQAAAAAFPWPEAWATALIAGATER